MPDPNQNRWVNLWTRLKAEGDPTPVYADLVERYAEPHRAYHNLTHISQCLAEFDQVRHITGNPEEVELAIWFHDLIYDPHAKDNEAQSAEFAGKIGKAARMPSGFLSWVSELILATRHIAPPSNPDVQLSS